MSSESVNAGILGVGSDIPDKIIDNCYLETIVDTSDEWIIKRTGISERHVLENGMPASDMGAKAAKMALDDAGLKPEDIGLIIVATATPDYLTPSTACQIQKKIGAVNAAAFDLNAACTGFIYAMNVAKQFICSGEYKYVLVIGCEALSRLVDWKDRATCILFGDGAGAIVMGPVDKDFGILGTYIGADGSGSDLITIPCFYNEEKDRAVRHENPNTIWMNGGEVFKFAVRIMEHSINKVLGKVKLLLDDIKLIIPHQANIRIIDGAAKRLGVSLEKVFSNVHKYGNISAASIPVALNEALKKKMITRGDNIVFVGFGGGLTWGSAVIKWSKK